MGTSFLKIHALATTMHCSPVKTLGGRTASTPTRWCAAQPHRVVEQSLKRIVARKYRGVYETLLHSDALLVELGVIASHPGAEQQTIHSDVDYDGDARRVYTSFVALQDVTLEMGPTCIWPATHTPYFCTFYKPSMLGPVDPYYTKNDPERMVAKAGPLDQDSVARWKDICLCACVGLCVL